MPSPAVLLYTVLTEEYESQDASDIEKVAFVPWRSELRSTIHNRL